MYHPAKSIRHGSLVLWLMACLLLSFSTQSKAVQSVQSASELPFPVLPRGKLTDKPIQMTLYQYDDKLLGRRTPLLLVHGLKAECWPYLRWQHLVKHLSANPEFTNKYKIFFARYDSSASLDKMAEQLQAKIAQLYAAGGQTPITILALSMGGNITYESMLNRDTDKQVRLVLAMGTPFHGSPLFTADWLQYGIYKRNRCPLARIDRSVAYRLYFGHKKNLLYDLRWDNCDQSIPDLGHFASLLPFGPHGNLTAASTNNQELAATNQKIVDKRKIIAYSGYLPNFYQWRPTAGTIARAVMLPYNILTITVPVYLGAEHHVLKMLNRQISSVPITQAAAKHAGSKYLFAWNDGITPVISALFLPDCYCTTQSIAHQSDLARIKPLLDVGKARVFRNIDHLTYLDGYRPITLPAAMCDELNPEAGKRDIFSWILFDLDCMQSADTRQSTTAATYN